MFIKCALSRRSVAAPRLEFVYVESELLFRPVEFLGCLFISLATLRLCEYIPPFWLSVLVFWTILMQHLSAIIVPLVYDPTALGIPGVGWSFTNSSLLRI